MSENPFESRFKMYTADQLLDIINNAGDYQPEAAEAARVELQSRNLTGEELKEAQAELDEVEREKDAKKQKIKDLEKEFTSAGTFFIKTIHPVQSESPTTDRLIRFLAIIFFAPLVFQAGDLIREMRYAFNPAFSDGLGLFMVDFLLSAFCVVIGVLLWRKKRTGWFLAALSMLINLGSIIGLMILDYQLSVGSHDKHGFVSISKALIIYLAAICIIAAITYTIFRQKIRETFGISKKHAQYSIIAGVGLSFIVILFVSYM